MEMGGQSMQKKAKHMYDQSEFNEAHDYSKQLWQKKINKCLSLDLNKYADFYLLLMAALQK
jgi:hypothetical protein